MIIPGTRTWHVKQAGWKDFLTAGMGMAGIPSMLSRATAKAAPIGRNPAPAAPQQQQPQATPQQQPPQQQPPQQQPPQQQPPQQQATPLWQTGLAAVAPIPYHAARMMSNYFQRGRQQPSTEAPRPPATTQPSAAAPAPQPPRSAVHGPQGPRRRTDNEMIQRLLRRPTPQASTSAPLLPIRGPDHPSRQRTQTSITPISPGDTGPGPDHPSRQRTQTSITPAPITGSTATRSPRNSWKSWEETPEQEQKRIDNLLIPNRELRPDLYDSEGNYTGSGGLLPDTDQQRKAQHDALTRRNIMTYDGTWAHPQRPTDKQMNTIYR